MPKLIHRVNPRRLRRDGQWVGCLTMKSDGVTSSEGLAIDGDHAFFTTIEGNLIRCRKKDGREDRRVGGVGQVRGMGARNGVLALCNRDNGRIELRRTADLSPIRSFQGANQADFSDAVNLHTVRYRGWYGYRWFMPVNAEAKAFRYLRYLSAEGRRPCIAEVIFARGTHCRIQHFSAEGTPLPGAITGLEDPTSLSIDHQGRLLVCENGKRQQVLIYAVEAAPKLVATFGDRRSRKPLHPAGQSLRPGVAEVQARRHPGLGAPEPLLRGRRLGGS